MAQMRVIVMFVVCALVKRLIGRVVVSCVVCVRGGLLRCGVLNGRVERRVGFEPK